MSFFNITQLGFQNYLREHSTAAKADPIRSTRQFDFLALPPLKDKNPPDRSIVPINQTSGYGPGHEGSFEEFRRLKIMHTRNPKAPYELYFNPPSTNNEIGWCNKDSPLHLSRPWTKGPYNPRRKSEMTRFVVMKSKTDDDVQFPFLAAAVPFIRGLYHFFF